MRGLKTLDAGSREAWREWLARHHDTASEVWLVFRKRHTGRPSIAYDDAVCEALCFGWIDSLIRRLDEERYARKFTPRKPDSRWSTINRQRYARLEASGRLTAAGLLRAPTGRSGDAPPAPSGVPGYIHDAFRRRPAAWKHFQGLPPSCRRAYLSWIDSAKRPDTRARRLREAVGLLLAGRRLGMK